MAGLVALPFADRAVAGRALAALLAEGEWRDPLVLGMARGGVPVAVEVAESLGAELDVLVVRKIGAPGRPEFGVGAVGADGSPLYDATTIRTLGIDGETLREIRDREVREAIRRLATYRRGRDPLRVTGRDVIVVDDGLATGITARVGIRAVRPSWPRSVVLAVPVSSREAAAALRHEADQVVTVTEPREFVAVGTWYTDFHQVTDDEVVRALTW